MRSSSTHFHSSHAAIALLFALLFAPTYEGRHAAAAQLQARSAEADFSDAYRLFTGQLYQEAITAFDRFRRDHPEHVNAADALYYQGEASLALNRDDEAVALFARFQRLYPAHPLAAQSRLAVGRHFYSTGSFDRAIQVFDELLQDEPGAETAAMALYWMGESALNQSDHEAAIGYFRRAADDYRQTETAPVALYAVGYTQVQRNEYDAAAEAFEDLAARHPDSPYAQNIGIALAEVYFELEDYQRAIAEINRRLPNLSGETQDRAQFLLAEAYNQIRDNENAIVHYRRFTEGNPQSPYYRRALYGLAWNYHFEGVYQWAVEHFARVREGHSDELAEKATYYQAVNQKLAEQPEGAIDLLEEYLRNWSDGSLADHARFELGILYYQQRLWEEAATMFTTFLRRHPDHELSGEAEYLLGNTAVALGNIDDALSHYERAIERDAAPAALRDEVLFQKAWLQYRNGRYDEAFRDFSAIRERAPRSDRGAEALFWSAESQYQLGELRQATNLFREYLSSHPGGTHAEAAHYALGWTHFRQGQYGDAITEFRRFLDAYREESEGDFVPYRTDALLRLADSYYALKRYSEAIRTYRGVAEQAGDYALYQIGQAFYNAGDPVEAIASFREMLTEYPDSQWGEEARYTLGYIFFQNQDYDQAISEYRKLIDAYPRDPLAARAQYGIGDALFNAGRSGEAVDAYEAVLERYSGSPYVADAAAGIQYALIAVGDDRRANAMIEDFARRNPNSPIVDELRFRQAEVKVQSGLTDAAVRDLERFAGTTRNQRLLAEAYYLLGDIHADREQNEEAISYLRRILENHPDSEKLPDAARRLGQIYLDEGQANEALNVYQRLRSSRSRDSRITAEANYGQGMALLQLGRTDEAERLLQDAIRTAPDAAATQPAQLGLARVYDEAGRHREALQLYREVVESSRDEIGAEALYRTGLMLISMNESRQAIEQLSRLPVIFSGYTEWVARGYLAQARAFQRLGQIGDASRVYDRVIIEFSGTAFAREAAQEKEAL